MTLSPTDTLLGQLQRGRGAAIATLLRGDVGEAEGVVIDCLRTPDPKCRMVQHVPGYIEVVRRLEVDLEPWFEWFAAQPAIDGDEAEDRFLFPAEMLTQLVARDVPKCWPFLWSQLQAGVNWRFLLSQARDVVPIEAWVQLLPRLRDEELLEFYNRKDSWWFAVARHSMRARNLLPEVENAIGHASRPHSDDEWRDAHCSIRRMTLLRDVLWSGHADCEQLLFEGLWDASMPFRLRCIEMVDLDRPGARTRLEELRQGLAAESEYAARRLRWLARLSVESRP